MRSRLEIARGKPAEEPPAPTKRITTVWTNEGIEAVKDILEWWEDGCFLNDEETHKNLREGMELTRSHREAFEMNGGNINSVIANGWAKHTHPQPKTTTKTIFEQGGSTGLQKEEQKNPTQMIGPKR